MESVVVGVTRPGHAEAEAESEYGFGILLTLLSAQQKMVQPSLMCEGESKDKGRII
jgi:hypothetical protein